MARSNPSTLEESLPENDREDSEITGDELVDELTQADLGDWYRNRQCRQNIRDGKSFFNGPPNPPEPTRHRPSLLTRCHRHAFYRQRNAPKETTEPLGLFWFGSEFEERVITPFLQDITPDSVFVQNSVWVDGGIEHRGDELVMKGMADPVLVNEYGEPSYKDQDIVFSQSSF